MAEFEPFPKIPRLNRDIVITEKIDGTNAAVIIEEWDGSDPDRDEELVRIEDGTVSTWWRVQAQSRKRLIRPNTEERKGSDNHGFAGWVSDNRGALVKLLGPGRHFGEWWGQGVQGRYPIGVKKFSLFNPDFHFGDDVAGLLNSGEVDTVPVLYRGPLLERNESNGELPHQTALWELRNTGSVAAPGCKAEGIIIFHTASRTLFKVTCENDEVPKEVAAREAEKVAANGGGKVDASIHWGGDDL